MNLAVVGENDETLDAEGLLAIHRPASWPREDLPFEMELLEGFLAQGKPVLGICRGCQLLNVAFGGTLYQDIATQRLDAKNHVDAELYDQHNHMIVFEPGSRLAALYGEHKGGRVTSIHHQAVDRIGADLRVEARAAEDGLIEAIRASGSHFVAGVQWHPEFRVWESADSMKLFAAFGEAVRARAASRRGRAFGTHLRFAAQASIGARRINCRGRA